MWEKSEAVSQLWMHSQVSLLYVFPPFSCFGSHAGLKICDEQHTSPVTPTPPPTPSPEMRSGTTCPLYSLSISVSRYQKPNTKKKLESINICWDVFAQAKCLLSKVLYEILYEAIADEYLTNITSREFHQMKTARMPQIPVSVEIQ